MYLPAEGADPTTHHCAYLLNREVIIPFLFAGLQLLAHNDEHLLGVDAQLGDLGGWDVLVGVDGCRVLSEGFAAVNRE